MALPTPLQRLALLALLAPLLLAAGCEKAVAKIVPPEPVKVKVVLPTEQVVTEYEEFTGRTWAVNTVEIRSRVSGYLAEVKFKDGAEVKKGQELFVVDDRSYTRQAAAADALVALAQAKLDRLAGQLRRAKALLATRAVTEEQYEQLGFDQAEAEASLAAAKAAKNLADLNVEYTRITANLTGTISNRKVDPGNIIKADETMMANIVQLDPIYAYFDINERTVLRLRRLMEEGKIESATKTKLKVAISLADEETSTHQGTIDFMDNQIDPNTGTLRVRATINNKDRLLSPGLFVRLRFPVGEPHPALLVNEEALVTDQGQRFVYVVLPTKVERDGKTVMEDQAAYRRVKVGMLVGGKRVIEDGVKPGERVIVEGLQRVKENTPVVVQKEEPQSPGITPAAAPGGSPPAVESPATTSSEASAFPPEPPPAAPTKIEPKSDR